MPLKQSTSRVAIGLLAIFLASPALGQGPLGMQLFAPADESTFGGTGPRPNEGYFFSFDGAYWAVQRPKTALIGATGSRSVAGGIKEIVVDADNQWPEPQVFPETSNEDTSPLRDNFSAAQRWEFGRVEDDQGWMVSIFRLAPQAQDYSSTQANVLFNDPVYPDVIDPTRPPHGLLWGYVGSGDIKIKGVDLGVLDIPYDLPVVFDSIAVRNEIELWGVEASYLRRTMTFHNGGNLEFYLGARYMEFNENFSVVGTGGVLDLNTHWSTSADNHIIGPQLGGRYFKQQGRWIFSTEGRFLAGYNRQNLFQEGSFGYTGAPSQVMHPNAWLGSEYSHRVTISEFSPLVELRLDLRYVITRAIDFRVGWTGFWVGGIARPSSLINYSVPAMGIDPTDNRQNVFVNGVTIGFDINR